MFNQLCDLLFEPNRAAQVVARLKEVEHVQSKEEVDEAIGYLSKHLEHMDYGQLKEAKLPIGSGVVESAIRRVNNLRFKSASMCWCPQHSEPLLYLRALCKSGHWDQFMEAFLNGRYWLEPSQDIENHDVLRRAA